MAALEHDGALARLGQVRRGHQAVVATADHDGVVGVRRHPRNATRRPVDTVLACAGAPRGAGAGAGPASALARCGARACSWPPSGCSASWPWPRTASPSWPPRPAAPSSWAPAGRYRSPCWRSSPWRAGSSSSSWASTGSGLASRSCGAATPGWCGWSRWRSGWSPSSSCGPTPPTGRARRKATMAAARPLEQTIRRQPPPPWAVLALGGVVVAALDGRRAHGPPAGARHLARRHPTWPPVPWLSSIAPSSSLRTRTIREPPSSPPTRACSTPSPSAGWLAAPPRHRSSTSCGGWRRCRSGPSRRPASPRSSSKLGSARTRWARLSASEARLALIEARDDLLRHPTGAEVAAT